MNVVFPIMNILLPEENVLDLKKKKYIKIFKGKRSIMSALIINVSEKKVNLGDTCTNTEEGYKWYNK